ncbi:MBL fold metallo-hydrolase [Treponema sp.]|uniref:MBL fold metallo-hydrolase n=1 Tax=Treponema sp. TaxID=166 RepID=UPI003890D87F
MKIYLHMNFSTLTNSYLVVNEETKKALIIDPCQISKDIITQIEDGGYNLEAALVTHKHKSHISGLKTLKKIYDISTYAADTEVSSDLNLIQGDGVIKVAGLKIEYFSVPGHSSDSIVYKIGNTIFTGDVIFAGRVGSSSCNYTKTRLCNGIRTKLFSLGDEITIMPGHGPLTSVGAEKHFNIDLKALSAD